MLLPIGLAVPTPLWRRIDAMNRSLFALLILAATLATADAAAPLTLQYTILSNGKPAGNEVDIYSANVRVDSSYEFNDRGRGPKILSLIHI